jgi:hypothetical protein
MVIGKSYQQPRATDEVARGWIQALVDGRASADHQAFRCRLQSAM